MGILIGALLSGATAAAEVVTLTSGETIEGEVTILNDTEISVAIPDAGSVVFSPSEIEKIEEGPEPAEVEIETPKKPWPWERWFRKPETTSTADERFSRQKAKAEERRRARASLAYRNAVAAQEQDCKQATRNAQNAIDYYAQSDDPNGAAYVAEMRSLIRACRRQATEKKKAIRQALKEGRLLRGMTKSEVRKAWGSPATKTVLHGKDVWSYRSRTLLGRPNWYPRSVTFNEDGTVQYWHDRE